MAITINIQPMPAAYRRHARFSRFGPPPPPPIFSGDDGEPTLADRELALELWRALDVVSRNWYLRGNRQTFAGLQLTAEDLAGLATDEWGPGPQAA